MTAIIMIVEESAGTASGVPMRLVNPRTLPAVVVGLGPAVAA
ncbi:hypothetical protein [Couchioplanes caeruleus]|nr:hypothetical protein [Couchioplanes caeruleus]